MIKYNYLIDSERIKLSKSLRDSIAKMQKGNRKFIMLDEKKVVYKEILNESRQAVSLFGGMSGDTEK